MGVFLKAVVFCGLVACINAKQSKYHAVFQNVIESLQENRQDLDGRDRRDGSGSSSLDGSGAFRGGNQGKSKKGSDDDDMQGSGLAPICALRFAGCAAGCIMDELESALNYPFCSECQAEIDACLEDERCVGGVGAYLMLIFGEEINVGSGLYGVSTLALSALSEDEGKEIEDKIYNIMMCYDTNQEFCDGYALNQTYGNPILANIDEVFL